MRAAQLMTIIAMLLGGCAQPPEPPPDPGVPLIELRIPHVPRRRAAPRGPKAEEEPEPPTLTAGYRWGYAPPTHQMTIYWMGHVTANDLRGGRKR